MKRIMIGAILFLSCLWLWHLAVTPRATMQTVELQYCDYVIAEDIIMLCETRPGGEHRLTHNEMLVLASNDFITPTDGDFRTGEQANFITPEDGGF